MAYCPHCVRKNDEITRLKMKIELLKQRLRLAEIRANRKKPRNPPTD